MKHLLLPLVFILFSVYSQLSFGQDEKKLPKIGLVLSGGGARGMAHIGVLKALEEAGIYPDIITGTSMGSVVGGLYSLGFTADEIEQIANETDWNGLLYNLVPFREIAIEEKPYYWRYMFELPVYGIAPELPSGVIEGENLYTFFSEITRSAHGLKSFDELPIPFRCVATDIATGKRVVMSRGSLASSIRASMAIPSIFTPVDINNQLLVDGGLVRNLPVQEAKEMGADIIIAVSVSEGLAKKEDLNSLAAILVQSSWLMSEFDTREQKKMVNLYLEPDLKGYGVADFTESEGIIARGHAIGEAYLPQFKALSDSLKSLGKQFKKPEKLNQLDTYAIQKISVQGNKRIPTAIILGKLRINDGDKLEINEINARLREVYGTQYFTKLEYEIIKEDEGFQLLIKVKEKPQVYFKAALYYNTETRAGLNVNLTARNKIWPNSRMLAEIDLSENFRTEFSFLKYLGKKQNTAATLGYQSLASKIPIFNAGESMGVFDDYHHNFYWLLQTTKRSTSSTGFRLDAHIKRYTPEDTDTFWSELKKGREYSAIASVFYTKNTHNNPVMPTRGVRFDASIGYRFFNNLSYDFTGDNINTMQYLDSIALTVNTHPEIRLSLNYFLPVTSNISLFTDTQLNYIFSNQTGLGPQTGLGGFYLNHPNTTAFWGASFYQFRALSYSLVRLGIQWEPSHDFFVLGGINYANSQYPMQWFNNSFDPIQLDVDNDLWGGGVQVIYNTRFGPIGAAIGRVQNSSKWQLGFNIGFWY